MNLGSSKTEKFPQSLNEKKKHIHLHPSKMLLVSTRPKMAILPRNRSLPWPPLVAVSSVFGSALSGKFGSTRSAAEGTETGETLRLSIPTCRWWFHRVLWNIHPENWGFQDPIWRVYFLGWVGENHQLDTVWYGYSHDLRGFIIDPPRWLSWNSSEKWTSKYSRISIIWVDIFLEEFNSGRKGWVMVEVCSGDI